MKVIQAYPPNYAKIKRAFPYITGRPNILFCYGGTIYAPGGKKLVTPELHAHEATHSIEQDRVGIEDWWEQYLYERPFRFEQECLAHRSEFDTYCDNHGSTAEREAYLSLMTMRLSSALYGRMVTPTEARQIILRHVPVSEPIRANERAFDVVV